MSDSARTLRGLTWDHPRGLDGLLATIEPYRAQRPEVVVTWDARSLGEFGIGSIEDACRVYDLLVVDHPFVGHVANGENVRDLSPLISTEEQRRFTMDSVGRTWASYAYRGGLWALPVDAAAQTAACRPDLLKQTGNPVPKTVDEVFALAEALKARGLSIGVTGCWINALCTLLTIAANLGFEARGEDEVFLPREGGRMALEILERLVSLAPPACLDWNDIHCLEEMVSHDAIAYVPYVFCYSNYARPGSERRIEFRPIPSAGAIGSAGALLGGAGIAVSRYCTNPELAVEYARFVCSPEVQRTVYFAAGGQPASLAAWSDRACDDAAGGFFSSISETLRQAYVRPRFDGFLDFFREGARALNSHLREPGPKDRLLDSLDESYRRVASRAFKGKSV